MKKGFFEGWYFKMQKGEHTLAAIPGYHQMEDGSGQAFLQLIIDRKSYYFTYPKHQFSFMRNPYEIIVDKCIFTKRSASFFLHQPGLCLKGDVGFGPLAEIAASRFSPDIMGPFSYLPFLQCRHGVLSMGHTVTGSVSVNGEIIDFTGGSGYLEMDRGVSFPDRWTWAQCNSFPSGARMMLAAATVPICGLRMQGVIGVVMAGGKEYRLATYNGTKLKKAVFQNGRAELVAANRKYRLELTMTDYEGQSLMAPVNGAMSRPLKECISCNMHIKLFERNRLILEDDGRNAGFEWQMEKQKTASPEPLRPISLEKGHPQKS
ncbi:MAG: hypothetical protein HFE39_10365 [Clostridiales bacterium]|jgi:tocopherol cyclase|nr:hypothetical protein [Clostridiales bacterium]